MGLFFPTGMRLVRSIASNETPWYWSLNGIFGVLCSALAVFIFHLHRDLGEFLYCCDLLRLGFLAQVGLRRANVKA